MADLTDADITQALSDAAAAWSAGASTIEDFFSDFFDIEGAAEEGVEGGGENGDAGNGERTGGGISANVTGAETAEDAHRSNDASTAAPVQGPRLAVPGLVTVEQRDMENHFNTRAAQHAVYGSNATNLLQVIEQKRAGTATQAAPTPTETSKENEQQISPATNLARHRRQSLDALRPFASNSDAKSDGAEMDAFFDLDEQETVARVFGAEPHQLNHAPRASAPLAPTISATQASDIPRPPAPISQTHKAPTTSTPQGPASSAPQTFIASVPQAPTTQAPQASTASTPQALTNSAAHNLAASVPAAPTIQVTTTAPQGLGSSALHSFAASAPQITAADGTQHQQQGFLDPRFMSQREFESRFPNGLVANSAWPRTQSMSMPQQQKNHAYPNLFPSRFQGQTAQAQMSLQKPQGQITQSQMPQAMTQGQMHQAQISQQTPAAARAARLMNGKQAYPPVIERSAAMNGNGQPYPPLARDSQQRYLRYPPAADKSSATTENGQSYPSASRGAQPPPICSNSLAYPAPQAQPRQQTYPQSNLQAPLQARPESPAQPQPQSQPHSALHSQPHSVRPSQPASAPLNQPAQSLPQVNQAQPNQPQPSPAPASAQPETHPFPRKPAPKDLTIKTNLPLPTLQPCSYANTPASSPLLPSSMPNVSVTPKTCSPAHAPPKTAQAKLPSQQGLHNGVMSEDHRLALMKLQREYERRHTSYATPGAKELEKDMRTEESEAAIDASSPITFKGPRNGGNEAGVSSPFKAQCGKKRAREDSPLSTHAVAGSARPDGGRGGGESRESSPDPLLGDGKFSAKVDRSPPRKKRTRAGDAVQQVRGVESFDDEQEDDDEDADDGDEDMQDIDEDVDEEVDAEDSHKGMEDEDADAEGEEDSDAQGEEDDTANLTATNDVCTSLLFSSSNPSNLSDVDEALLQEIEAPNGPSKPVATKKRTSAVGVGRNPIGNRELASLDSTLNTSPMKHPLRQSLSRAQTASAAASAKSSPAPTSAADEKEVEAKGEWRGRHPLGKDELKSLADGNGVGMAKPSPRKTRKQRESEVEIKKLEEDEVEEQTPLKTGSKAAPKGKTAAKCKGKAAAGAAKAAPKTKASTTKGPAKGAQKGKAEAAAAKAGTKAATKAGTVAATKGKADATAVKPAAKGKAGAEGAKKSGKGK